jgi:hypothetical protein
MNEPTPQIISRMIVLPARGQHIDGGRRGPFENWDSNSDAKALADTNEAFRLLEDRLVFGKVIVKP